MPKKYTLEGAYAEILKIKNQMGIREYQEMELKRSFEKGYSQAIEDMQKDFLKRSSMFNGIKGNNL